MLNGGSQGIRKSIERFIPKRKKKKKKKKKHRWTYIRCEKTCVDLYAMYKMCRKRILVS